MQKQDNTPISDLEKVQPVLELDHIRQGKARELGRNQRRLFLVELAIGMVYLLLWLLTGWSKLLTARLIALTSNELMLVAIFALIFGGVYFALSLPLSFYEGYVLPHRFCLSTQTLKNWIADQLKAGLIAGVFGFLILEIIYALLRSYPDTWWLMAAGFILIFNVLLANLAPVLLFPIFYKFKPLGETRADLEKKLIQLADAAQTPVCGVYQFDMSSRTRAANAALTGLGNTRRIILGDTLLNEFSDDEIETVLAHELGHQVHKDIQWNILISTITTLAGFFVVSIALSWGVRFLGFSSVADIAALPLFGLILGLFGLITMPLSNSFSRWRERLADRYALEATRKNHAFASAMKRLANQNLSETNPEPWIEWLLYSHPALNKRIAMAENYQPK